MFALFLLRDLIPPFDVGLSGERYVVSLLPLVMIPSSVSPLRKVEKMASFNAR